MAKRELLATIRGRYQESSKKDNSRILDEFIAVTGHHRIDGIRLLGQLDDGEDEPRPVRGRRIYDGAVREAVAVTAGAAGAKSPHPLPSRPPHRRVSPLVLGLVPHRP